MPSGVSKIINRRSLLRLSAVGVGAVGFGVFQAHRSVQVDYRNNAYSYWNKNEIGALDIGRYLVLCGSLAPSPHNTQPWKYELAPKQIAIFADRERNLGQGDSHFRMMLMSIGCALENMRVAAAEMGYDTSVDLKANKNFENSGLCAVMHYTESRNPKGSILFDAIFKRQTVRSAYQPVPMSGLMMSRLSAVNDFPFLGLKWIGEADEVRSVSGLNKEAVRLFVNDDDAYLDSLEWWRYTRDEILSKRDGISIFTSAAPSLVKQYFQKMVDTEMMRGEFGRQGEVDAMDSLFNATPTWGCIYSEKLDHDAKISAGQLAERIYLEAARRHYGVMPLSYISEQERMSNKMKNLCGIPRENELLMVFRIGKGSGLERSVRRPLSEIII